MLILFLAVVAASIPAFGVQESTTIGAIAGVVSAQQGGRPLAGAEIVVSDERAQRAARRIGGGAGRFSVAGLPAGTYRVAVSLRGFAPTAVTVAVIGGQTTAVSIEMTAVETIDVVASSEILTTAGTLAPGEAMASRELDQFVPGTGFQSAVRMFAAVMATPGGVNIKGGRPNQAGVQLGAATLVDPASAIAHVPLPDDAIDSVTVLPNPYAVEYGRFASGLVVIETKRARDQWRFRVSRVTPTLRNKRDEPFRFRVDTLGPRYATGGPLIKGRLFLEETGQLRYSQSDVPSRPETELRTSTFFSSFSRVDAKLSPRHSLVGTVGLFPNGSTSVNLGTFTPPDATVDLHAFAKTAAVTERTQWTSDTLSETTVQILQSRTEVVPHGTALMELQPENTLGNFFNNQYRNSTSIQLVETLTVPSEGPWGSHLFKIGVDVLAARYDGTSDSRPVLIERVDGTLARRLDYEGASSQSSRSTDVSVFAQDRLTLNARWQLELGGRIDRDGIIDRVAVSPRIGTAVQLGASGSVVLRGGIGLFHGRTPSVVGAFGSFTSAVDARFAADGVTPLGPAVRVSPVVAPGLEIPRSRTWDVSLDYRRNERWAFHANFVNRDARGEFIVEPILTASGGQLRLSTGGESSYRDLELGVRYTRGGTTDVEALYDWSSARGDLNSLTNFFDAVMAPVVGANAYAPLGVDVPHRFFVRGRMLLTPRWLVLGVMDWRTGVPYSTVDEMLEFIAPRNARRFPNYARVELGLERRFEVFKWMPWAGVRVTNVFDAFLPSDVQANTNSPLFGSFYNSEDRHLRVYLRLER